MIISISKTELNCRLSVSQVNFLLQDYSKLLKAKKFMKVNNVLFEYDTRLYKYT